jgi:hypothetical protein
MGKTRHVQVTQKSLVTRCSTTERCVRWPLWRHVYFVDPSNWLWYWPPGVRTDFPSTLRPDRFRGPTSILSSGSKGKAGERDVDTSSTEVKSMWSCTATTMRLDCVVPNKDVSSVRRFRKLRTATYSFVMSVRQSVWSKSAGTERIFMKFGTWRFFWKFVEKIQVSLKSDNNRYFAWRSTCICDNFSLNSS